MTAATASAAGKAGFVPAPAAGAQTKFLRGDGTWQIPTDTNTDTKNTTGTTNKTGTKMFLAGATSQAANPQTYSNSKCYIGTDNCLYSNGSKVGTASSFQAGVDTIYNAFVKAGTTPTAKTPAALSTAVTTLKSNSLNYKTYSRSFCSAGSITINTGVTIKAICYGMTNATGTGTDSMHWHRIRCTGSISGTNVIISVVGDSCTVTAAEVSIIVIY